MLHKPLPPVGFLSRAGIPLLPVVLCFRAESEEDHRILFAESDFFA
jgi:hypothetical protein